MPSFLKRILQNVSALKSSSKRFASFLLVKASKYNQNWCIQTLLRLGAKVNTTDTKKNTALHYAALNNNTFIAKSLIEHGAAIKGSHVKNKLEQTPWDIALLQLEKGINNLSLIGALLKLAPYAYNNHKEFEKDVASKILFKEAREKDSFTLLNRLITKIDVNALDDNDNNLLNYAALKHNKAAIKTLILHGAILDPNRQFMTESTWNKILKQKKLDLNTLQTLGLLLKVPVDKIYNDAELYETVATKALFKDAESQIPNFKHLETFIDVGADINAQNKNGNTLLHFAAGNNSLIAMNTLIENGAFINTQNYSGMQSIHFAARGHANFDYTDENDGGALQLLLNNGAYPNAEDFLGNTPLHAAVSAAPLDIDGKVNENAKEDPTMVDTQHTTFNILLNNDADETLLNNKQQTLLHIAALNNNIIALEFFLNRKCIDVNAQDLQNNTALHYAVLNDFANITHALLLHGAYSLMSDLHGNIPLHYFAAEHSDYKPYLFSSAEINEQKKILKDLMQQEWRQQLFTKNNLQQTPLHTIIAENPPVIILEEIFQSIAANDLKELLILPDIYGNTLLHIACEYSTHQFYKPKYQKKYSQAIVTLEKNALAIAELLVKYGANLNAKNSQGLTPLTLAAKNNVFLKLLEQSKNEKILQSKGNLLMSHNAGSKGNDSHNKKTQKNYSKIYPK